MLNWILGLGMYPIVFILYFVLKNTAKPQKGFWRDCEKRVAER